MAFGAQAHLILASAAAPRELILADGAMPASSPARVGSGAIASGISSTQDPLPPALLTFLRAFIQGSLESRRRPAVQRGA